jgi:hypothetical protein
MIKVASINYSAHSNHITAAQIARSESGCDNSREQTRPSVNATVKIRFSGEQGARQAEGANG